MRIISQNGLLDAPYELLAISPYSGNMATIVGTFPGNDIGKGDRVYILGEYSSEEKAIKAMEMCREKYQGFLQKVIACLTIRRYSGFQQMMRFRERGRNERAKRKESDHQKADETGKDI